MSARTLVPVAGAVDLLAQAAALARDGSAPRRLEEAGSLLARFAPTLDLAEAESVSRHEDRSVIIASDPSGSMLAVRWFAEGRPTTIHDHGTWGVIAVCKGSDRYERWERRGDAGARLVEVAELGPGGFTWWGKPPDDLHRQMASDGGALELILIGREAYSEPNDFDPEPGVLGTSVELLSRYDVEALAGRYRADVLFDANVPYLRYQLQGPEAILEMIHEEVSPIKNLRVTCSRALYGEDSVTVEVSVRFDSRSGERRWREVHLIRAEDELVIEHTVYCTGFWDAATINRQAAEAPMIRP